MAETVSNDRPPVASRPQTVSASALAQHLDCSRIYVSKLEAEGVIQRQGDGFPLDQSSRDMQVRRSIDAVVDQVRCEMAVAALAKADEWNEPSLDNQD